MTGRLPTAIVVLRALRLVPAFRRGLGLTVGLAAAGTAVQLAVPVLVQQTIDRGLVGPGGVDAGVVTARGAVVTAFLVGALIARRTAAVRLVRAAASGLADLQVRVFDRILRLPFLVVAAERRGALVGRVTSDVETITDFMEWGGVGILLGTAQVVLAVGVMVAYSWRLALVVVAGVAVYAGALGWFQRILRRAHDRVRVRVGASLTAVGETISGLPTVRAFGAETRVRDRVGRRLDLQFEAEYRTGLLGATLFSSAEVFAGVLLAAVVGVGVILGPSWDLSAGRVVAFLFLVGLVIEPVQLLVEVLDEAQSAGAGLRRLFDVLDEEGTVEDPVGGVDLPDGPLDVRFEEVSYRYPEGPRALHDVTVAIAAGSRVAVVGETGSGKTTFARLAVRVLDPAHGAVLVGGMPLQRARFASLRRRVGFVPQEPFLFEGTIADNIRYGRPDATTEGIRAAFADLGLDDWLAGLPAGAATRVGERGGELSSGERQLVALVRAWIAGPDLLVLDEATSAVDPALDVRLRRAMERLTAGRTSITIAHRLATAEAADEVLVFADGGIVERGTHDELMALGGTYARLHRDWIGTTTT